MFHFRST